MCTGIGPKRAKRRTMKDREDDGRDDRVHHFSTGQSQRVDGGRGLSAQAREN